MPVPLHWLPHVDYIVGNPALSVLGFCIAEPHGVLYLPLFCINFFFFLGNLTLMLFVSIQVLTLLFSVCIDWENLIREALHLNPNYKPNSNMPPKFARRFASIPTSIGGRGDQQGRGSGRGTGSDEDDRNSMPLIHRKSSLPSLKRKAEGTPKKVSKRPAKEPAKEPVKGLSKSPAPLPAKKAGETVPAPLMKGRVAEVGSSSIRPAIYKQLTLPAMIPALRAFAKPRKSGFLERSEVEVPDTLQKEVDSFPR